MNRAIFICKIRLSYGNSYGLSNSANFIVEYLNSVGIETRMENVIDANSIDKVVTEFNPTFVFIEALWVTPEKLKEIMSLKRHSKRIFIVRIHSRPTFIANEGIAFEWLLGYRQLKFRNLFIAPNNEEFCRDLKETFKLQSIYLPNIYYPPKYNIPEKELVDKEVVHVGCFGSVRPMKNHLTQAISAVRFARLIDSELEFHINSTRMEQHGDQVLKNLRNFFLGQNYKYRLVEHDWLSHEDFINTIRTMDIGMQVSLSETFNIIAADFVNNKIPFVGSRCIPWLPLRFSVEDPNSTDEITRKLEYAWSFTGNLFRNSSNKSLNRYNKEAQKVWNNLIGCR